MTGNKRFTIDDLTSYTANNFEDKNFEDDANVYTYKYENIYP